MSITPIKNPYNEVVSAEFLELQSEIDTLLAQLQSLSRQRLSQTGSPQ